MNALQAPSRPAELDAAPALVTVEEWALLTVDVLPPIELVKGQMVQKMTTTNAHDWATKRLARALDEWADTSGWRFFSQGVGLPIDASTAYVPDVTGFAPEVALQGRSVYNEAVPSLVAEVLSPATARLDRTDKKTDYARLGVPLYLIVDPANRTLEVYALQKEAYAEAQVLAESDVWQPESLPNLRVELARLWF